MSRTEVTPDDILQWPHRSSSSANNLHRALADAQAQIVQRDRRISELGHRFANSLQVLSSSLKIDSRRALHKATKAALDMAATRVIAVARLHQYLEKHETDRHLDLNLFLRDLGIELENITGLGSDVDGETVIIDGDMAFKLAVVVTELVLNARKHAYDGEKDGRVYITCRRAGAGQLRLSVSDRGKGLPMNFNSEKAHGIGMLLVLATTKQLNGQLNVQNAGGASFILTIPIDRAY